VRSKPCRLLAIFLALVFSLAVGTQGQEKMVLVQTGSSMPEPLYNAWIDSYHKESAATEIRYRPVGSAESARNTLAGSGDFACRRACQSRRHRTLIANE
jgi:ABC-type phosphate transport system substrate-binding protein